MRKYFLFNKPVPWRGGEA